MQEGASKQKCSREGCRLQVVEVEVGGGGSGSANGCCNRFESKHQ